MLRRTRLKRKTGLSPGQKRLERKEPLRSGKRPARKPPAPRTDLTEAAAWHRHHMGHPKARCRVCGSQRRLQVHHVLPQQLLRRKAADLGLDPAVLLWDKRVGMVLDEVCHDRHTRAFRRVPRHLLTLDHWDFARQYGLDWKLEADYPEDP